MTEREYEKDWQISFRQSNHIYIYIYIPGEPKRIGISTNTTFTFKIFRLEKINWHYQKALIFILKKYLKFLKNQSGNKGDIRYFVNQV